MTGRLADRTALITGAGSGIGRAAAVLFAAEGANVVVCDRDAAAGESVAAELGTPALAVQTDVTSLEDVERAVARAVETFGGLNVLYANAGIEGGGQAHSVAPADWQRVIDVNLTGVWHSIRAALGPMLEAGAGSIITQASTAGLVGVPGLAPYSAAKGGVISLTRQVAVEYGRSGIRANTLCPGTVWTPLVSRTYEARGGDAVFGSEQKMAEGAARAYPLRRLGTPDEVAAAALFLASDEAAWITGAVFATDGGYTAQ